MPATYAHYSFGHEVLKLLDENIQKTINRNVDLYNIGLHGPDILFYYKPLKSNHVNRTGYGLHKLAAGAFFENARQRINCCHDCEAALAYISGFICHFILDSQCHPYIRQKESVELTHSSIETEFDRLFMLKNNLNPTTFRPTSHIKPNLHNAEVISVFFDDISKEEILKALKDMKFYLNFLVAPGRLKRSLITSGLKVSGNYSMTGLMMCYEPFEACKEVNEVLYDLYVKAVEPTAGLIEEYCKNIKSSERINERFSRNLE